MTFAERLARVSSSQTQQVALATQRLQREGIDVVDLGAGEPDFDTPVHIRTAAIDAINAGFTKYTPNAGISELKESICRRYSADYDVTYEANEVIVCAGGKQALFNVAMALFNRGDEIITHAPVWPTIVEQIRLAGSEPVIVRTYPEDGFAVTAERVLSAVTPRTRAIVLNSPGNPTGALIAEEELAVIVEETETAGIWLVLDLCYEQLIYEDVSHNLPAIVFGAAGDRTVLVGSTSKSYAMTGWRCGWALGPRAFVEAANTVQSHVTSNVSSITQHASVAALAGSQHCVEEMRTEYRTRRDRLIEWLAKESRIRVVPPAGAFYLFPDISELLSPTGIRTSAEFASRLLEDAHVALTPGEAFDAPGFLRLSYATSVNRLKIGADRIQQFVTAIGTE